MFDVGITNLLGTLGALGVLVLMAILFAECGLFIGFFLPGDTILFTAGFLATRNVFGMSIHLLVALLFIAAVTGEGVGYWFGRKIGPRIFNKKDSILFHQDNLQKAEQFYQKYGPITILLARFVPLVRTFAPIVAGVGNMRYRQFFLYNIIGGLIWTAGVTYLGYFAGAFFEAHGIKIDNLILPIIGLAMLFTLGSPLLHILRSRESRAMLLKKLGLTK